MNIATIGQRLSGYLNKRVGSQADELGTCYVGYPCFVYGIQFRELLVFHVWPWLMQILTGLTYCPSINSEVTLCDTKASIWNRLIWNGWVLKWLNWYRAWWLKSETVNGSYPESRMDVDRDSLLPLSIHDHRKVWYPASLYTYIWSDFDRPLQCYLDQKRLCQNVGGIKSLSIIAS